MVFSCLKSQLIVFKAYRHLCSNSEVVLLRDNLVEKVKAGLTCWRYSTANCANLSSSAACFHGLKHINSHLLPGGVGPKFHHTNRHKHHQPSVLQLPYRGWLAQQRRFTTKRSLMKWIKTQRFGFGVVQKIPYSERIHVVIPEELERHWGNIRWENEKKEFSGRTLSPTHPQSVRVQSILRDIVQAMHNGLMLQNDCKISVYAPKIDGMSENEQLQDRLLVSKVIQQRSQFNMARKRRLIGLKYSTKHLDGLDWEVMVVDSDIGNAEYIAPGKIIFCLGMLRKLKSDDEVATLLAHEVGHGVARHLSKEFKVLFFVSFVYPLCRLADPLSRLMVLFQLYVCHRMELEADYIGLMLMASAGYDPRVSPKLLKVHGSSCEDFMGSTHPSGERRAKRLEKPKVMEAAITIFEEVRSGHGVRSFV